MASSHTDKPEKNDEQAVHEQGTIYVDESNLDVVLSTKPPGMFKLFWKELKHDKLALIALFLLVIIVSFIYISTPIIESRMDVMRSDLIRRNQSPEESGTFLGTDSTGRSIAPLMMVSARNSLNVAFAVTFFSFLFGLFLGLFSGYFGGHLDNVIMRVTDTWTMLPDLMILIALISILPRTTTNFIILLTAFTWMGRTRLIRAVALQNRNLDYISASKTLGTRNFVIIVREMLPNMVDVVVANFVLTTAANIGIETGLSLLGFGMGMEHPSLGTMIQNALQPINLQFFWWTWAPAVVTVVTLMLCINFVGNALQRVADPRQRLA